MRDSLGRFYTDTILSNLLIDTLTSARPLTILDIGFGEGSLTDAAYQRWGDASYYAIEIEQNNQNKNTTNNPNINLYKADVLSDNIQHLLDRKYGSFDLAVCNPPYLKLKKKDEYADILKKAKMHHSIGLSHYTSDLIFLAYNLLFLKTGGELGIILPDGLLTSHSFMHFRRDLVFNYTIKSVIQLPDRIFKKTEARTHIIVLNKLKPIDQKTELHLVDDNGQQVDKITVSQSDLIDRMDFSYHRWQSNNQETKTRLFDLGVQIKRGNYTQKQLKAYTFKSFHTTNFKDGQFLFFENNTYLNESKNIAEEGDILIARVGKRCIGKIAIVKSGRILFSDCVYRLRVNPDQLCTVWNALQSDKGKEWFSVFAHGVCSQVISKRDLLNFPIN